MSKQKHYKPTIKPGANHSFVYETAKGSRLYRQHIILPSQRDVAIKLLNSEYGVLVLEELTNDAITDRVHNNKLEAVK